MKLIKNFLYNASYQIFILIIPLLTTPYLARVLGPQGVGINSYTNSVMQYFVIFGCLGTNIYGNRKIAFVRDNKYKLSQTFWEIFLLRFLMLLISLLCFIVLIMNIDKNYFQYYVAQGFTIIANIIDISWFFMGIERFSVTVIRNFLVKIVTLVCIFVFVKSFNDLFIYILILSVSTMLGNLTMVSNLKGVIYKPKISEINFLKHFYPSLLLFIPEVATQIYLILNKTMLGSIVSVQASGFYDQSDKIVKIILAVVTATGTVMLPHVANAFSNGQVQKTKEYLYDSFSIVTSLSVPMFFGLMAISSKLVPLFFTDKFLIVVPLMQIESIVIVLIAWSNAIGIQYLLPTKQTKKYTTSVILGAIVNIILNVPLILWVNTFGAIISTVISEFFVTAYQIYSIRNQISMTKLFKDTYKYMIAGLIMFIIVFLTNDLLSISWVSILIEVVIGILVYAVCIMLLRVNLFSVITRIKNE